MSQTIKTKISILSDTHGRETRNVDSLPFCDVAIYCGDMSDGSGLEEYQTTIQQLTMIKASLKLVIAGNHDFTLDQSAFDRKVADAAQPLEPELVAKVYDVHDQARKLFDDAKESGIVFLNEGLHQFVLANGAKLTVYAGPYTPFMGQWGFRYHPDKRHDFSVEERVDIAITHGSPKGTMNYTIPTYGRERAGYPELFTAIANAQPWIKRVSL